MDLPANSMTTGDVEFLEAAHACIEILQSGGGSEGEITEEFHARLHRGTFAMLYKSVLNASLINL